MNDGWNNQGNQGNQYNQQVNLNKDNGQNPYNNGFNQNQFNGGFNGQNPYNNNGFNQFGGPNPYQPVGNQGSHPDFVMYLVLSILQTFCCFAITGVISIVFTVMGNSAYQQGNIAEAESKFRTVKTTLIVGLVIGIIISCCAGGYTTVGYMSQF